jgi:hypothetical protein
VRLPVLAVAVLTAGLLAGCGVTPTDPLPFGEPARGLEIGQPVYFLLDGRLYPTLRPLGTDDGDPSQVVNAMAAGPLPAEQAAGLTTEVPAGLRVASLRRGDGGPDITMYVFGPADDDPNALSALAVQQLTCTAFAAFKRVQPDVRTITLSNKAGRTRHGGECPVPASSADGRGAG